MLHTSSHCVSMIFSVAYPASWFVLFQGDIDDVISKTSFLQPWFVNLRKFCACVDQTFLVPNESTWQSLERQREIIIWSSSLHEKKFICRSINRFISPIFYQFQLLWIWWVFTSYFVILKIFCMSLFGRFWFWAPTRFPEVICPWYDPG